MFWVELAFDSSTSLHGTGAFRFCIPNLNTIWNDVKVTLETIESIGREVLASEMDNREEKGSELAWEIMLKHIGFDYLRICQNIVEVPPRGNQGKLNLG